METSLAFVRYNLRYGWLLPAAWTITGSWSASAGAVLSAYVFLGYGLLILLMPGAVKRWVVSSKQHRYLAAVVICLLSAAIVAIPATLFGLTDVYASFWLNWAALTVMAVLATLIYSWDFSYESVQEDFRLGIVGIVASAGIAYGVASPGHLQAPTGFVGIIGYGIFGLLSLTFARRYSPDALSQDKRSGAIDSDWITSAGMLLLAGGAGCIVLLELLGHNITGDIAALLRPFWNDLASLLGWMGSYLIRFLVWLGQLFHIHVHGLRKPRTQGGGQQGINGGKKVKPTHSSNSILGEILTGVAIAVVVVVGLWALSHAMRRIHPRRGLRVHTESTGEWTIGKLGHWLFGRARTGLDAFVQQHMPRLPHRQRYRTMRDVYRGLQTTGAAHGQARHPAQTASEYGSTVTRRWQSVDSAVAHIAGLYISERYGGATHPAPIVAGAVDHLMHIDRTMDDDSREGDGDHPQ